MSLIFNTGNTLDQTLKNDQKLPGRIIKSLQSWKGQSNGNGLSNGNGAYKLNIPSITPPISFYRPSTTTQSTDSEENSDITAKLFLPANITPEQARITIEQILSIISNKSPSSLLPNKNGNVPIIKYFIVSLEGLSFSADSDGEKNGSCPSTSSPSTEQIAAIWKQIVEAIQSHYPNLIEQYGIAELSTDKLVGLLDLLEKESVILPTVDHINAADCCALPPGLLSIAKKRGIRLLAHHDPEDMLPSKGLKSVLQEYSTSSCHPVTTDYSWDWILRLTYIAHDRQVLTGNEYLVSVSPSS